MLWPACTRPKRECIYEMEYLLMFAKYSVGAQRAAPALARHLLCPKTTLYSAGINRSEARPVWNRITSGPHSHAGGLTESAATGQGSSR